jgi:hypothetical protein
MAGKFPGPDSKFQVCVVTDQKAEDHSGNQSCYSPIDHGEGVDLDHLALSSMLSSPVAFLQQIFPGGLDPGTGVVMLKQAGELGGIILGQSNSTRKGNSQSGGGKALGSAQKVEQLTGTERDINIAPDIKEVEENGVKIRKVIEKGKQHKLDLLDGLPVHGALFDIAGFRLPEIKNVPTAKQTNDQMMSVENLQQMAGQIMSLGQMIQGLAGNKGGGGGGGGFGAGSTVATSTGGSVQYAPPGTEEGAGGAGYSGGLGNNIISAADAPSNTPLYEIMEGLTPNMKAAVNSLSVLLQGYETEGGVAFMTGDVVHEDTYLGNAQQLLSKANTLSDLMYVMNRLQWDESIRGTEKLSNVVNEIETAWGVALQEIDYNGNMIITYGSEDANNEIQFTNDMTSNTGSPGLGFFDGNNTEDVYYSVNSTGASLGFGSGATSGSMSQPSGGSKGGTTNAGQVIGQVQGLLGQIQGLAQGMNQNMFGESAGTMKDMWKRMTREQENDAKGMHKKLNQDGDTQKMSQIAEKLVKGGNPFTVGLFDESMLESIPEAVSSNFGVSVNPNP